MTEDIEVIMKLRYATRQAICRTLNTMLMDNIDELNDDIAYWKRVGWDAYDGGDPDKKLNEIKTTIKEFQAKISVLNSTNKQFTSKLLDEE